MTMELRVRLISMATPEVGEDVRHDGFTSPRYHRLAERSKNSRRLNVRIPEPHIIFRNPSGSSQIRKVSHLKIQKPVPGVALPKVAMWIFRKLGIDFNPGGRLLAWVPG
jgi:hypothetical protein